MKFKESLKNNDFILSTYGKVLKYLTLISPKLSTKVSYFISKGMLPNLQSPTTIEEKLSWLKLNDYANNPLVIKCADKLAVRGYVTEVGYEDTLNELLNVYSDLDELKWNQLPEQFALKWTVGSGGNFICPDKNSTNLDEIRKQLGDWKSQWDQRKPYLINGEMQYSHIEPKIILEKYLGSDRTPIDYKIYCFNGEPKAILMIADRSSNIKGIFMSPEWTFISNVSKYDSFSKIPEKPNTLEKMVKTASDLSKPFPFVRVDFYDGNEVPIFGEMTFTPAGGLSLATTEIEGVPMGDYLELNIE
ncbi:ATP-grasp fold amidoligase family protein [Aerococcus urinaeequi]|uniref:ATP-grasp fold amidoligase family protein n=1 Tax=Aerococcus urinaeequi TaxID=51665 RepID=UPI003D6C6EAC